MECAVIGGGWAGCSAAVELARHGHQVQLFEASRTLGGRARQVEINELMLDNGQHILLGAYHETLKLLKFLKIDPEQNLLRVPLQICYPPGFDGMQLVAPKLPSPWHMLFGLIGASGLTGSDKLALLRFSTTARWMDWQLDNDCTVSELLTRYDQTANAIQLIWRPLCLAALNTPPDRASAKIFLNVLKDSLGASRAASDMLIPRCDLSNLMPLHAQTYLRNLGGEISTGCAIQSITQHFDQWRLDFANGNELFDAVIIATPAEVSRQLLAPHQQQALIPEFEYEPISTCYLQYSSQIELSRPLLALRDDPEQSRFGQFVFDRGQLDDHPGLLSVVISASKEASSLGHETLSKSIAHQLAVDLNEEELDNPMWCKVITEKRATFASTPNLQRPTNQTPLPKLFLAGDYTQSPYPATIETAVRSGIHAASLVK